MCHHVIHTSNVMKRLDYKLNNSQINMLYRTMIGKARKIYV